ncbi:uncharacterized protein GGS22DRAFT_124797 [Annulohypoxylon maeteangense]|uniref:uncharacterized protein n=1 Tax=Annulohypoxylon maeteangense TaxID=1927788 RepID=UPI0020086CB7|nr:uncharacterized protein GGS22DRAFT_124797 [Annulohypoxylon maeteangense]KAI0886140.1 hypothetical protein GGS22DRAFT_124797 [Annulohypoxylon maeteangense]
MDFVNHPYRDGFVLNRGNFSTDVNVIPPRPPRKSSLNNNFSYPRPDSQLRRHESSDSCSSLASNGSVPGMTDSSDSETSFEDDSNYNTTAGEIWDTFWPDSASIRGEQYPALLRTSQAPNYFTKNFPQHEFHETDDTITIPELKQDCKENFNSSCDTPTPQPSPPRSAARNGQPTYSVYPRLEPAHMLRVPLPPRTSSLNTAPSSPPRRHAHKSSRPNLNLKSSKSSHNLRPCRAGLPTSRVPMLPVSANSVPASPAHPPPPPPRALRSVTSAINLRDKQGALNQSHHNAVVPLSPLNPTTPTEESQPTLRPEIERLVSVFEVDSDHESYMESNSFTRRIARGFHKKSASEKRNDGSRRGSSDSQGSEKENTNRKRGGSLGRILGLKSR